MVSATDPYGRILGAAAGPDKLEWLIAGKGDEDENRQV
jgi:hypothetical protein